MRLSDSDDAVHAGPPFQLPYSLATPDEERLRWRTHRDIVVESQLLLNSLTERGTQDAEDPFLLDLREADGRLRTILEALAGGNALPSDAHFTKFQKAAHILEEAVRGFTIEAHGNFWTGIDREHIANLHMFNSPFHATRTMSAN